MQQSTTLGFEAGIVVHSLLPPHEAKGYTSTSQPFAFGVSFTGHRDAVIELSGEKSVTRSFAPNTVGLNGMRPLTWLRVAEPSEGLEIHPTVAVLANVTEETRCRWQAHDRYLQIERDPVIWGACARFRMAALGTRPLDALEADSLIYGVAMHVATAHLDGRKPRFNHGRLDRRRLKRVCAYLQENLQRWISLAELSSVAALSPYHLQRSFKLSTGLSPSDYAMALRMEKARRLLAQGRPAREAAAAVGLNDLSYFRRCYRRQFAKR